jgi:drug/metabolite transporter (DMT)-like permease
MKNERSYPMKTLLLIAGMVACTVIANLLLKTGAVSGRAAGGPWWSQVLNGHVLGGYAVFAVSAMFYTLVLRTVPLNVAQSFTAAQFIAVVLSSAIVLSEPIGTTRWIGIAMIAAGIILVGWTHGMPE